MTFLIFILGVSITLNTVTGIVAFIAAQDARKNRRAVVQSRKDLEVTRRDVAAVLTELKRLKPKPAAAQCTFGDIIGAALANHEAISRVAAEIAAK